MLIPEGAVVAVGLASEAALLPAGTRVLVSGGDAARLAEMLEALPADVTCVLSFGIAGGLAPEARTGEVLLAGTLHAGQTFAPDATWTAALAKGTGATGTGARVVPLAASETLLADVQAKRALHAATGAHAVDMESGAVARFATTRGLPFAVLRAVADGPEDALPRAAHRALTPDGRPALGPVLAGLARRPWELPALIGLGRASARAHAALAQAISSSAKGS
ncbi:phosphorylase family protein [Roseococcus suduntuyensis]|uniref:Hopanoid-associated phosphorylase n=1 Tax=Roseococcus suduntuyensis TaxID=455361 RepID=A0A840AJY4_9PROT|nr:nucleoside phosphorylase [Roseococcus suduntuyensis]MBB3900434.1 hopanoid-associated phosphorylase [Roseococcus suduntuyensis]